MTLTELPDNRLRFYSIRFQRLSTGSAIAFVAATKLKRPRVSLRAIFQNKFPGWIFQVKEISLDDFTARIEASHEANLIDFDHRHPDELFVEARKITGNFFDPWRFT
jgi:hypothetical protein